MMRNLKPFVAVLAVALFTWSCSDTVTSADEGNAPAGPTKSSNSINWGVNIHDGGSNPELWAEKLSERNFTEVRMDYWGNDPVYLAKFRNAVQKMNAQGIEAHAILFTNYSQGNPYSQDYGADLNVVETNVYNGIKPQIIASMDIVKVFELQNEVPLYSNMLKADTYGQNTSDFDTPAGRLQAAVLRGMSRAIDDVREELGLPIRIVLGTVNRYWGFLSFMEQNGVIFDIVGYHIYPWEQHATLDYDPWFGAGGPLGQLALFNRPIHINEFNSGEIYDGAYENQAGQTVTEKGFDGLYKHLSTIANYTGANIESVHFYEACDESNKPAPENRFGLYHDTAMANPKISLLIATAFAGGQLSQDELDELQDRGFIFP